MGLGIDIEEEDAIQAFREGKYPELNNLMGIAAMYFLGRQRGEPSISFFQECPPALRDYLQETLDGVFQSVDQGVGAGELIEDQ